MVIEPTSSESLFASSARVMSRNNAPSVAGTVLAMTTTSGQACGSVVPTRVAGCQDEADLFQSEGLDAEKVSREGSAIGTLD